MRQPPNSMSAVGPPMWVNRVSDMRRNLGASAGMVEIWDGLSLDRVRHAPRRVIARWPRVKYLRPGTSESTPQTGRAASLDATPERTELGNTEIFLVQTPTGELRLSGWRRRVGVLHFHQPIAPPIRERRRFQIDAVDAETVQFLECRELARDALDQVSMTRRLVVAVGDRQVSTSTDMVASAGSSSSRKLPRIACEPTTISSRRSNWQAVRMVSVPTGRGWPSGARPY